MAPADRAQHRRQDRAGHHRQLARQAWHDALKAKRAGNAVRYRAHFERARLHEAAALAYEDQAADW